MKQAQNVNRRIVLASRPVGAPTQVYFCLEEHAVPVITDGQVLLRTLFLSFAPYMRGRMSDAASYAAPVVVGNVMVGHRYGEFYQQMSDWLTEGRIKYREDIVNGLENAPKAFIGLLEGDNFGKLVVRIAQD
jgi:NADPH-dependent curcumin reductase CurA